MNTDVLTADQTAALHEIADLRAAEMDADLDALVDAMAADLG